MTSTRKHEPKRRNPVVTAVVACPLTSHETNIGSLP